ncbi:unnamed protein product [Paramecium sonneborni]|uniref:Uncharacterized protein n=1 Tax=Paramecium sonneborni TaxID=65129 RepID=A0A8S1PEX7_9CILI|nr:unnamed protein product [Paramecium sonneborni]
MIFFDFGHSQLLESTLELGLNDDLKNCLIKKNCLLGEVIVQCKFFKRLSRVFDIKNIGINGIVVIMRF